MSSAIERKSLDPSEEPVDEVLQIPPSLLTCGGCQQNIGDRYFLKAIDQYWHEDCLSCDLCGCRLGEVGRRLYYKLGRKLCRRDYLRSCSRADFQDSTSQRGLTKNVASRDLINIWAETRFPSLALQIQEEREQISPGTGVTNASPLSSPQLCSIEEGTGIRR
ncbi:hypothetical protein BTVI_144220 [Pitangus sulphuratus]|nr:hypothetical protein BTVI_144220 [Pitangus sulphuratus]